MPSWRRLNRVNPRLLNYAIRPIDFTSPTDVARHDQMVALVERMLDLHERLAAEQMPHVKTVLQRQPKTEATDRQIDLSVYGLRP